MKTNAASPRGTPGFAWKAFIELLAMAGIKVQVRALNQLGMSMRWWPGSQGRTHVLSCALIPDGECVITQLLVFQPLLVFPSSIAED